jgi:outer membrane lipoprotein-sorting protein
MGKITTTTGALVLLLAGGAYWAAGRPESVGAHKRPAPTDPVDAVLEQLNQKTRQLKSFQCQIEHKYVQPLLESQAIRKGLLYYMRSEGKSALRVNFETLQQEDEKEQKAVEQYIVLDGALLNHGDREFKGIWLVHIDYRMEEVKYYQLAEPEDPNKPMDVFELASKNLPMLGFTKTEELKKQFEVELIGQKSPDAGDFTQVRLKVKPNSVYKDDFLSIDFWIDEKVGLPAKVRAIKIEPEPPNGDIEEIKFLKPKVNKDIDAKVFEFRVPKDFGEPEIKPLPKKGEQRQHGPGNSDR